MATTEILPFATDPGALVESQVDYEGSDEQLEGFQVGIADPSKLNKVWRQSSFMAAGLANWIVSQGTNVPDDGNLAALVTNLQTALVAAITTQLRALAGLTYQGVIDCSGNPNYPASSAGYVYVISVAGKIGGGSGINVEVGDLVICKTTNAGGTQAAVGANFDIIQANIDGAVIGPSSAVNLRIAVFDGITGKLIADGGAAISTDGTFGSDSDAKIPTEKAINTRLVAYTAANYQPLDGDLTALAALSGTNTIYYRSAANTWTAVTIGTNITFSGGTLSLTITLATQAEQEAASSTTNFVSSGRQHFHPSALKFHLYADAAGDILGTAYNVTSISDTGTGLIGVTLTNALSSADYPNVPGTYDGTTSAQIRFANITAQLAGSFSAKCCNHTPSLTDPVNWSFLGAGDM